MHLPLIPGGWSRLALPWSGSGFRPRFEPRFPRRALKFSQTFCGGWSCLKLLPVERKQLLFRPLFPFPFFALIVAQVILHYPPQLKKPLIFKRLLIYVLYPNLSCLSSGSASER
jgi:hypothetical protein